MSRRLAAMALGVAATALVPSSALAASTTVSGSVSGSVLSVSTSASPSFSANLDSGDQTPTFTVPLTIQDTRGTGAGWNGTITSTQYTTGGLTPVTLATNASSLTAVTSACASGTCTNPTNAITYPIGVPAASTPPTAVKFYNAAANSGMGKFTITPTIGVFVPQNSFAGTYTSTLTISIVSGP
jgi:hypothetical protein